MKKILSVLLTVGFLVLNFAAFQVNATELNPEQNNEFEKNASVEADSTNMESNQQTE